MKFYDIATITLYSGKGGDGIVSGRREKYVPYGGPAGGDGGKGSDIVLEASLDENTLIKYKYKKEYKANKGENGMSKDKFGKSEEALILKIPVGTAVKDKKSGIVLYQFTQDKEQYVAAKGGRGGWGNKHFVTSTNQFPQFALLGEPGEIKEIVLELQLLADLALIGTPSVGKSSIINCIANTKVKVAEYHFTTIIPNLGIVKYNDTSFTAIDVPGLIQGAAVGRGLGNDFLRHILKARIYAFVLDVSKYEIGIKDFGDLFYEIINYIKQRFEGSTDLGYLIDKCEFEIKLEDNNIMFDVLAQTNDEKILILRKLILFVINKFDLVNDEEVVSEYKSVLNNEIILNIKDFIKTKNKDINITIKKNTFIVSAAINYNLDRFIKSCIEKIDKINLLGISDIERLLIPKIEIDQYIKDVTDKDANALIEKNMLEESDLKFIKIWEICNNELSYLANIIPWGNDEAELRFWSKISKEGFISMFENNGIRKGDILKVKSIYSGVDDKYIVWD